jgi:ketosteroid isomerase-like protein
MSTTGERVRWAARALAPAEPRRTCARRSGPARWFLDRRGRITLDTKLVVRVGDLAFLTNRWSLTGGTMPDGSPAELGAATAEVARRQSDGT